MLLTKIMLGTVPLCEGKDESKKVSLADEIRVVEELKKWAEQTQHIFVRHRSTLRLAYLLLVCCDSARALDVIDVLLT